MLHNEVRSKKARAYQEESCAGIGQCIIDLNAPLARNNECVGPKLQALVPYQWRECQLKSLEPCAIGVAVANKELRRSNGSIGRDGRLSATRGRDNGDRTSRPKRIKVLHLTCAQSSSDSPKAKRAIVEGCNMAECIQDLDFPNGTEQWQA